MAKKRIADLLVETLSQRASKESTESPATRSTASPTRFAPQEQIRWVHVRHEETAAFAAGAEAHLTGSWPFAPAAAGPATCI